MTGMRTLTLCINFGIELSLEEDEREHSFNSAIPLHTTGVGSQDMLTVRKWLKHHTNRLPSELDCLGYKEEGVDGLLADIEISMNEEAGPYKMFIARDYEEAGTDEDETSIDADSYSLMIVFNS